MEEHRYVIKGPQKLDTFDIDTNAAVDYTDFYFGPGRRIRVFPRDKYRALFIKGKTGNKIKEVVPLRMVEKMMDVAPHIVAKEGVGQFTIGGQRAYAEKVNGEMQVEIEGAAPSEIPPEWVEIADVYSHTKADIAKTAEVDFIPGYSPDPGRPYEADYPTEVQKTLKFFNTHNDTPWIGVDPSWDDFSINYAALADEIGRAENYTEDVFGPMRGYDTAFRPAGAIHDSNHIDMAEHPDAVYAYTDEKGTTAAGRYQFLYDTWKILNMNTENFYPSTQYSGAVTKMQEPGRLGMSQDFLDNMSSGELLSKDQFESMIYDAISREWASFPKDESGLSQYGTQPAKPIADLYGYYKQSWDTYKDILHEDYGRGLMQRWIDRF